MDLIKTGKIISDARKNKNMTQKQLASKLHISDKAISKWERGLGYPDISLLIPLSKILDITLYELLSGEEEVEETLKNAINYSNKEIKRKKKEHSKKTFIITSIIILFSLIFGYKGINLLIYGANTIRTDEYLDLIEGYQVKDVEIIKTKELEDNQYIIYKGAKVKNIFNEDYEHDEENDFVRYQNQKDQKYFSISLTNRYIDYIDMDMEVFGIPSIIYDSIDKNNIITGVETDLELFNYFYENRNNSINIFSSTKEMKKYYYIKNLSYIMLPTNEYITELKGDLKGYILNISEEKNIKEISIEHNNQRYVIMMFGYEDVEILEIINTFIIEK